MYAVKTAQPVFRRNLRKAPAHPIDDRILVRENKPKTKTDGGLHVPESAAERCMNGWIVAVGDAAADYLYDRGIELGDLIHYARYAGVVDEWPHIVGPDDQGCEHDSVWEHVPQPSETLERLRGKDASDVALRKKWELVGGPNENIKLEQCRTCGTLRATERVIVMSCKDVLMDVDLQERLETGIMSRYRGDANGSPRFYIKRETERPETFEYAPVEKKLKGVA
jgi:co-chaperonin GroES (HSP10)